MNSFTPFVAALIGASVKSEWQQLVQGGLSHACRCTKALPGRFVSNSVAIRTSIQATTQNMNALYAFVLFVVLLKCVRAGGTDVERMLDVGNKF